MLMESYYIPLQNDNQVGIRDLNEIFINMHKNIPNKEQLIDIVFKNDVISIDIVFIAGLFLFYKTYGNHFSLRMDDNSSVPAIINDFSNTLNVNQYLSEIQQLYEDNTNNIHWISLWGKYPRITKVHSFQFAPILFVDNETLRDLFSKTDFSENSKYAPRVTDFLNHIKNKITYNGKEPINSAHAYFKQTKNSIIDILKQKPIICTFVVNVLIDKVRFRYPNLQQGKELSSDQLYNIESGFEEMMRFVLEYVSGLYELAKNIVEHSSVHKGIITIRAYSKDEIPSINRAIETHVIDLGERGIIDTLIAETKNKYDKAISRGDDGLASEYFSDLEILQADEYSIEHFLRPSAKYPILYQQIRRSIAHYGLIHFFNMIKSQNGFVVASSFRNNGRPDGFEYYAEDQCNKTLGVGTHFFFGFPSVSLRETISEGVRMQIAKPLNNSIDAFAKLLSFQCNREISPASTTEQGVFFISKPNWQNGFENHSDESEFFTKEFSRYTNINPNMDSYLAVNLEDIEITPSILLRLIYYLSENVACPLIITNVDYAVLAQMIQINQSFFGQIYENGDIPYWRKNNAVLIYSRYNQGNEKHFVFADMLYGVNENEFLSINKTISLTFPNTTTICNGKRDYINVNTNTYPLNKFFFDGMLLPFDVLPIESGTPLFVNNMSLLIEKNI